MKNRILSLLLALGLVFAFAVNASATELPVEMPDLGEIAASYDTSDFQIIGIISDVAEDAGEEDITNAKDLIQQTGANYPHLLLNQSLYINLVGAIDSVPTTFFINQEGEVMGYVVGAQSKEAWEEIINDLLAENK